LRGLFFWVALSWKSSGTRHGNQVGLAITPQVLLEAVVVMLIWDETPVQAESQRRFGMTHLRLHDSDGIASPEVGCCPMMTSVLQREPFTEAKRMNRGPVPFASGMPTLHREEFPG
jgi:hypothetical protein